MPPSTRFYCQECGYESLKWLGKCPECQRWNTLVEEMVVEPSPRPSFYSSPLEAIPLSQVEVSQADRLLTKMDEFDRALGGGLVPGSLVLIGGDPGIGKSTLLLQAGDRLSQSYGLLLYVSGEESAQQVKLRSERLGLSSTQLYILPETNLSAITTQVDQLKPRIVVIDSIQTIYKPELSSSPGSVGQIRECTNQLMYLSKGKNIPLFIVGHVTKDGSIAGPRVLEHIVDTVLYFEGEAHYTYRILRAIKNRFGSTNEIGVFEMRENGLKEVTSPSSSFLAERCLGVSGSIVTSSIEGTRPILVEIQSLVTTTNFGLAKRESLGVDYNRVALLLAVLEKKIGLQMGMYDVFVNVAGGMKVFEPAADLAISCAIVSSFKDRAIDDKTAVIGEVGLSGEIRGVSYVEKRVEELTKLGFNRCLLPEHNLEALKSTPMHVIGIKSLYQALEMLRLL